jgi:hypothetical protein
MLFNQASRLAKITSPLGPDVLLLNEMGGGEELGRLFNFELQLTSLDANIDLNQLLGKPMSLNLQLADGGERHFHGIVARCSQNIDQGQFASYQVTLRPWLWLLSRTSDCRIFQNLSIPQIIKQVFRDLGFSDFEDALSRPYREWEYCVQYRETSFDFVSRLMEQEGIYYFFRHEQDRHVLVLADADDGMRRAVAAFRQQLQARGGSAGDALVVAATPGDMTASLQAATQKEGGVDALFLALKPAQVRALAPQLALAGLAGKPRVGTSQLTGAGGDDHALDGIAFPSDAWTVRGVSGLPSQAIAGKTLPSARGPAAKLFAFGYDAWLLTAYLERLALHADGQVQGATGTLRLDGFGNVVRTPAWSTYNGESVVPLGNGGR